MQHVQREVSVIGLGAMGAALARMLLRDGHRVTVWNRNTGFGLRPHTSKNS